MAGKVMAKHDITGGHQEWQVDYLVEMHSWLFPIGMGRHRKDPPGYLSGMRMPSWYPPDYEGAEFTFWTNSLGVRIDF